MLPAHQRGHIVLADRAAGELFLTFRITCIRLDLEALGKRCDGLGGPQATGSAAILLDRRRGDNHLRDLQRWRRVGKEMRQRAGTLPATNSQ
ncbi:Putative uncharacterized protein Sb06g013250 (plasmid) [Mesorhizobium loti]|nr:Putative uncharacterized protein Sb06g013250 [Mesorhizobium loti]BCH05015.1 hypothetical protein MesoLj131b_70140 [Mesorhizobium sp. 131-2-5]